MKYCRDYLRALTSIFQWALLILILSLTAYNYLIWNLVNVFQFFTNIYNLGKIRWPVVFATRMLANVLGSLHQNSTLNLSYRIFTFFNFKDAGMYNVFSEDS